MQPSLYAEHSLVAVLHLGSCSPDLVLLIDLAFLKMAALRLQVPVIPDLSLQVSDH